jgi:hypothetical protein
MESFAIFVLCIGAGLIALRWCERILGRVSAIEHKIDGLHASLDELREVAEATSPLWFLPLFYEALELRAATDEGHRDFEAALMRREELELTELEEHSASDVSGGLHAKRRARRGARPVVTC